MDVTGRRSWNSCPLRVLLVVNSMEKGKPAWRQLALSNERFVRASFVCKLLFVPLMALKPSCWGRGLPFKVLLIVSGIFFFFVSFKQSFNFVSWSRSPRKDRLHGKADARHVHDMLVV